MADEPTQDNLDHLPLEIVATYSTPTEAGLAIQILAEAGIRAKADQEAASTWLWHASVAIGGIHVLVLQSDLLEAREVLLDKIEVDEVQPEQQADESEDNEYGDIKYNKFRRRAIRAAVIGLILLPPLVNLYSFYLIIKHRLWTEGNGGCEPLFALTIFLNFSSFAVCYFFQSSLTAIAGF